jgi:hypothetical protein
MNPRYGVYAARVKPDFEPLVFKPAETLGKAVGLCEAFMKWFGKRKMFYVILDHETGEPVCMDGDV